nr:hypothetical protein [Armatimonas sp.]
MAKPPMTSGGPGLTGAVMESIRQVECLLPGHVTVEGSDEVSDPRWQAIITLEPLIESAPEVLWPFIARWGSHPDEDLRMAIATCLLEHLLESHFATYFPRVEALAQTNSFFGETFQFCWPLRQAQIPENRERYTTLSNQLKNRSATGN